MLSVNAPLLRLSLITLLASLAACTLPLGESSPSPMHKPAPVSEAPQQELLAAQQALEADRFSEAEQRFLALLQQAPSAQHQPALIGLVLVYLDVENPNFAPVRAIDIMDKLNASLADNAEQRLMFASLQQLLETSASLSQAQQKIRDNQARTAQLQARLRGLEQALEKLRKISLQ